MYITTELACQALCPTSPPLREHRDDFPHRSRPAALSSLREHGKVLWQPGPSRRTSPPHAVLYADSGCEQIMSAASVGRSNNLSCCDPPRASVEPILALSAVVKDERAMSCAVSNAWNMVWSKSRPGGLKITPQAQVIAVELDVLLAQRCENVTPRQHPPSTSLTTSGTRYLNRRVDVSQAPAQTRRTAYGTEGTDGGSATTCPRFDARRTPLRPQRPASYVGNVRVRQRRPVVAKCRSLRGYCGAAAGYLWGGVFGRSVPWTSASSAPWR